MVFNPLFFNTTGKDSESFSLKSLKTNSVNYLFADIIKVYAGDTPEINSSELTVAAKQSNVIQNQAPVTSQQGSGLLSSNVLAFLTLPGIKELVKQNINSKYNTEAASANTTLTFDGKITEETAEALLTKLVESLTKSHASNKAIHVQKNQNQVISADDIKAAITDLLKSGKPVILKLLDNKVTMEFNLNQIIKDADKNDLSGISKEISSGYEIKITVAENNKLSSNKENIKNTSSENSSGEVLQDLSDDKINNIVSGDKTGKQELSVSTTDLNVKAEATNKEAAPVKIIQPENGSALIQAGNKNVNSEAVTLVFNISDRKSISMGGAVKPIDSEGNTQKLTKDNADKSTAVAKTQTAEQNKKPGLTKEIFSNQQKQAGTKAADKVNISSDETSSTETKLSVDAKGKVILENNIVEGSPKTKMPETILPDQKSFIKTQTVMNGNSVAKEIKPQLQNTKTTVSESRVNSENAGKNKSIFENGNKINTNVKQTNSEAVKSSQGKNETNNTNAILKNIPGKSEVNNASVTTKVELAKSESKNQSEQTSLVKNGVVKNNAQTNAESVAKNESGIKISTSTQLKNNVVKETTDNKTKSPEGNESILKKLKEEKINLSSVSSKSADTIKNNYKDEPGSNTKSGEIKDASNFAGLKKAVDIKTVLVQSKSQENKTGEQIKSPVINEKTTGNLEKQSINNQTNAGEQKVTTKIKTDTSSNKVAGNTIKTESQIKLNNENPVLGDQTKSNSGKNPVILKEQLTNANMNSKVVKNDSSFLKDSENQVGKKTSAGDIKLNTNIINEVADEQPEVKPSGNEELTKEKVNASVKVPPAQDKEKTINTTSAYKTEKEITKSGIEQKSVKESFNAFKEKNISKADPDNISKAEVTNSTKDNIDAAITGELKSTKNISAVESNVDENKSAALNSTVSKEKEIILKTNVKKVFVLDGKEEIQAKQKSADEKPAENKSVNRNIEEEINAANPKIKSTPALGKILFAKENDADKKIETHTVRTDSGSVQTENSQRQESIKEMKSNSASGGNQYSSANENKESSSENNTGNKKQTNDNNIFGKEISSAKSPAAELPFSNGITKNVKNTEVVKEITKFILKKESSSVTLNLEPETFGKVKVTLDIIDNSAKVIVEVENEIIKKMIENNVSQLFQSLSQNGLALTSMQVSTSGGEPKQAKNQSGSKKKFSLENEVTATEEDKSKIKSYGYNTYEFLA